MRWHPREEIQLEETAPWPSEDKLKKKNEDYLIKTHWIHKNPQVHSGFKNRKKWKETHNNPTLYTEKRTFWSLVRT